MRDEQLHAINVPRVMFPQWALPIISSVFAGIIFSAITIFVLKERVSHIEKEFDIKLNSYKIEVEQKFTGLDPRLSVRVDALEKRVDNLDVFKEITAVYIAEIRQDVKYLIEKSNRQSQQQNY